MPIFELQGPDGSSYEVDAPHEQAAVSAFQTMQSQVPSKIEDAAKSLAGGIGKGVAGMVGLPAAARDLVSMGFDKAAAPPRAQGTPDIFPEASTVQSGIESVTGPFHTPQTTAGKYAQTMGEFLPAAMAGGGNMISNAFRYAAIPGAASEAAGQATQGTPIEPYARLGAGVAGSMINPARIITPNPITPGRQAAVNVLEKEGVKDLTAGQVTGNQGLLNTESVLADAPFSGRNPSLMNQKTGEQFTSAALKRVGENAPRATPEVVDGAFKRIGNNFETLSARNAMQGDARLGGDLFDAERQYQSLVPQSQRSPIVGEVIKDIGDAVVANNGSLPGTAYQALRSRLSAAARGSDDPHLSHALSDITESLDDAMARSIKVTNPSDAGGFEEARRQYRNMLVIERAATAAGEKAASGLITPQALASATKQVQGRRAYARGQGDFSELAHAGNEIMTPLPQSGTAPRMNIQHNLELAALLGGGAAAHGEGAIGTGIGALAGIVGPPLVSRALFSGPVQSYLANQLIHGAPTSPQARNLLAAQILMKGSGSDTTPSQ